LARIVEPHVRLYAAILEQPEVLKHDAEAAPQLGDLAPACALRAHPVDPHLALARLVIHVEELEDRRLAGAAGPGEKNEFALLHLEGDVCEGDTRSRVFLGDFGEADHRYC